MAKLRFFAREDHKVTVPLGLPHTGQPPAYVGRVFVPAADGKPAHHPATDEPFECDEASTAGHRLSRTCRFDQTLWPADEYTAAHCGQPFVRVAARDGVVEPPAAAAPRAPRASTARGSDD